MRTVRFSIGLFALAILASAVVPAHAAPSAVGPVADTRFGIAEGFRNPSVMADIGAGWERVVLSWADIQPNGPDDFSWLGRTLPPRALAGELTQDPLLHAWHETGAHHPCCTKSAIHAASRTSVLRPGTALRCWALTTSSSKCPSSRV